MMVVLLVMLMGRAHAAGKPLGEDSSSFDPAILKVEESRYLGQGLNPGTEFRDQNGKRFALSEALGKPVILVLSYYGCDGSCPTVNQNLVAALADVRRFKLGRDFRVLTVSFDRHDTGLTATGFVQNLRKLPADFNEGWRFAVMDDVAPNAPALFAKAVGFQFFWSRPDKMFVHPNVLVFLTPEGRVARYIYGTRLDARTLELALIDADWGRITASASNAFDMITGACYSYNFSEGRYQANYALMAGVGALTLGLSLMGLGFFAYRRKLARRTVDAL
jgi:protein SCO1/2